MYKKTLLFASIALTLSLLSSCTRHFLDVQTMYFSHKDLASSYVQSPDPRKWTSFSEQRLIIQWSLPKELFRKSPITLNILVRYGNGEEENERIILGNRRGTYLFKAPVEKLNRLGRIQTYRVYLSNADGIIRETKHPIWTKVIEIED